MITASMNRDDFVCVFTKDKEKLTHVMYEKGKKLYKEMRKGFRNECIKCYDITTNNADYKMIVHVKGKVIQAKYVIIIPETKEYVLLTETAIRGVEPLLIFTTHCLKRIWERFFNEKSFDLNKCLVSYFDDTNLQIPIYRNGNDLVSVTKGGLMFQKDNSIRHTRIFKTFVSFNMMGETQKKAFEQVKIIYDNYNSIDIHSNDEITSFNKISNIIDQDYIYKIYGEYFLHKRSVKKELKTENGVTD